MKNTKLKTLIAAATIAVSGVASALPQTASSGFQHSMFLDGYGNVYVAGNCYENKACGPIGERGILNATYAEFQNAKYVFAGNMTSAIIDNNGDLYYAGNFRNTWGQTMPWTKISAPGEVVDAAWTVNRKLYFLVKTGTYRVKGKSYPSNTLYSYDLKTMKLVKESDKSDWIQIAAHDTVVALDKYGDVYTWGGTKPELYGDGSSSVRTAVPTEPSISGKRFRKVTVGQKFAMGLTVDGVPFTWGNSLGGGEASSTPVKVKGVDTVKDAIANYNNAQFIDNEGRLMISGSHNLKSWYGQAMSKVSGTELTMPFKDAGLTQAYTPVALVNSIHDTTFFYGTQGLMGYSANQYGELAMGTYRPFEYHVISRVAPFKGTPPMISATTLCGSGDANKGHGNDESGFDCDNPAAEKRSTRATEMFAARADGRGFKRSN